MRKEINEIVREWAIKHGGCYQLAWNSVYKEFRKQKRIYVKARARHRKVRPLDIVEQLGLLEILKKVAVKTLK